MKLLNIRELEEFCRSKKRALASLSAWATLVRNSEWRKFADVKATTSRSTDKVGRFFVFNVGGNHYRVIALIDFEFQVVRIVRVLDHEQYDRGKWKDT